jgi:hypothetical protein
MHRHETWLRALATLLHYCTRHVTPLICFNDYEWTGTEAEWNELKPLADRISPYIQRLQSSGQRCEQCGEALWCRQCYEVQARTIILPDDLMTEGETKHYLELLQHIGPRAPSLQHTSGC